ncbi:MAG TPA: DNRLRE domain-containing protein [Bacteroidia bacterium]|nr:DNRLRE domain-containing protein [Bacteroidia bacterium]
MKKRLLITGYLCAASTLLFAQTTTITLQPNAAAGKDAEVFSCVPCGYDVRNFGTKKDLDAIAWTNNGDNSNVRSLIQFDLSAIPAGATITDARLSLYNNPTSDEGGHFTSFFNPNTSVLQRITSSWDELTVTWNTQPTVSNLNKVTLSATTSSHQNFLNIDVRALVADMLLHPTTSFGFRLKLTTEKKFRKLIFASSDHATASIRPKLVVTYSGPAPKMAGNGNEQSKNSTGSFDIFPNPAKDLVTISIHENGSSSATLKIYNLTGNEIYNRSLQLENGANSISLQTDAWAKGIYFIAIKTSNGVVTQKLIVE